MTKKKVQKITFLAILLTSLLACNTKNKEKHADVIADTLLIYKEYSPESSDLIISREKYSDKLYGFWLGQCIANWTGLVTEMDKIGNIGEIKTYANSEEAYRYTEEKFKVGMATALELEEARNRLFESQSGMISAKYVFIFYSKILDFYQGKEIVLS